jgi:hypothetical protein
MSIKDLFEGDGAYEAKVKELNDRMEAIVAATESMAKASVEQYKEKADWVTESGIDITKVKPALIKQYIDGANTEDLAPRSVSDVAQNDMKIKQLSRDAAGGSEEAQVKLVEAMGLAKI